MNYRVDRFINLFEAWFGIEDVDFLTKFYNLMKVNRVGFYSLIRPYILAALDNVDLITPEILKNELLLVRLGCKNGGNLTEGYDPEDLNFLAGEFEAIGKDLRLRSKEMDVKSKINKKV